MEADLDIRQIDRERRALWRQVCPWMGASPHAVRADGLVDFSQLGKGGYPVDENGRVLIYSSENRLLVDPFYERGKAVPQLREPQGTARSLKSAQPRPKRFLRGGSIGTREPPLGRVTTNPPKYGSRLRKAVGNRSDEIDRLAAAELEATDTDVPTDVRKAGELLAAEVETDYDETDSTEGTDDDSTTP